MFNHAPKNYACPICLGIQGVESDETLLKQADLVYKDELVSAFINSFWVGKNEGHIIVVPNDHYENIYELPEDTGGKIFSVAKKIALALKKTYDCDGVTIRQNNEPASEQHAFHYHLHVFPRYKGDEFNQRVTEKSRLSDPTERLQYAKKLKDYLEKYGL